MQLMDLLSLGITPNRAADRAAHPPQICGVLAPQICGATPHRYEGTPPTDMWGCTRGGQEEYGGTTKRTTHFSKTQPLGGARESRSPADA